MSTQNLQRNNSTRSVQHSKELALDEVEFEDLYHGASQIDDPLMQLQAEFAVVVLGRLGLRAGELAHLREEWVDWRREVIEIPMHQPCRKGKDGGACARCIRLAEQKVDHNPGLSLEEAVASMWSPKTEAGARGVYFGWDARAQHVMERFFDQYERWPRSVQVVSRRVSRAAEHASDLDAADISPHPLRATAASSLAARGLGHSAMMQFMGWSDFSVASAYIKSSTGATANQLESLNSR